MRQFVLLITAGAMLAGCAHDPHSIRDPSYSRDALLGGALGAAAGAAVGNAVGGNTSTVVGGALGAAVGAAIATEPYRRPYGSGEHERYDSGYRTSSYPRYSYPDSGYRYSDYPQTRFYRNDWGY
jgi:uncharacterized protein YcfJ